MPHALRVIPVPDVEPPAVLDLPGRAALGGRASQPVAVQGTLALSFYGPVTEPDDDEEILPRPTPLSALPEPRGWTTQFVQAAMEVLAGTRHPQQLLRWTTPAVHQGLVTRIALQQAVAARRVAPSGRPVVRSVRTCSPAEGIVEASAVVLDRGRVRAVALRLEGVDNRWRVTVLQVA